MIDVGWNPTIAVAQKMGIKSELKPTYSLALGSWEVNLLELTSAYGTLANKGVNRQPYGISKIRDRQDRVIYEAEFVPKDAVVRLSLLKLGDQPQAKQVLPTNPAIFGMWAIFLKLPQGFGWVTIIINPPEELAA